MVGRNLLPMKELVVLLEGLGAQDVKTYHQSGNAVFRHRKKDAKALAGRISTAIREQYGFEPQVLLLDVEELERIVADNPFPEGVIEPELCVIFLSEVPEHPDLDSLDAVRKESERFKLHERVFYLHAREGTYRSKMAWRIERSLGVSATGRTWSTIKKVMTMVKDMGEERSDHENGT